MENQQLESSVNFTLRYQKINWKKYFELTTLRVAFLGLILALNIVLAIFSKFVMGLIKVPPVEFLVLELTIVTYFIVLHFLNLFYTIMFVILATWMRWFIGDEPIGMLAMNIIDVTVVLAFWAMNFLLYKLMISPKLSKKQYNYRIYFIQAIAGLFAAAMAGAIGVLINWGFLLKIYGIIEESRNILLIPIMIFNFLKVIFNIAIYLSIFYSINLLFEKYDI